MWRQTHLALLMCSFFVCINTRGCGQQVPCHTKPIFFCIYSVRMHIADDLWVYKYCTRLIDKFGGRGATKLCDIAAIVCEQILCHVSVYTLIYFRKMIQPKLLKLSLSSVIGDYMGSKQVFSDRSVCHRLQSLLLVMDTNFWRTSRRARKYILQAENYNNFWLQMYCNTCVQPRWMCCK